MGVGKVWGSKLSYLSNVVLNILTVNADVFDIPENNYEKILYVLSFCDFVSCILKVNINPPKLKKK